MNHLAERCVSCANVGVYVTSPDYGDGQGTGVACERCGFRFAVRSQEAREVSDRLRFVSAHTRKARP